MAATQNFFYIICIQVVRGYLELVPRQLFSVRIVLNDDKVFFEFPFSLEPEFFDSQTDLRELHVDGEVKL